MWLLLSPGAPVREGIFDDGKRTNTLCIINQSQNLKIEPRWVKMCVCAMPEIFFWKYMNFKLIILILDNHGVMNWIFLAPEKQPSWLAGDLKYLGVPGLRSRHIRLLIRSVPVPTAGRRIPGTKGRVDNAAALKGGKTVKWFVIVKFTVPLNRYSWNWKPGTKEHRDTRNNKKRGKSNKEARKLGDNGPKKNETKKKRIKLKLKRNQGEMTGQISKPKTVVISSNRGPRCQSITPLQEKN